MISELEVDGLRQAASDATEAGRHAVWTICWCLNWRLWL